MRTSFLPQSFRPRRALSPSAVRARCWRIRRCASAFRREFVVTSCLKWFCLLRCRNLLAPRRQLCRFLVLRGIFLARLPKLSAVPYTYLGLRELKNCVQYSFVEKVEKNTKRPLAVIVALRLFRRRAM